MNDQPLPEILQAEWDADQVRQLFADLSAGAQVEHVQLRTDEADATVDLAQAGAAFSAGAARAIQVRYLFENEMWCDTIMPGDPTTKIIRNRLPDAPPTE
ncbi:MAG: hypothetical protein P8L85_19745 [Rubripirellula sp.]|nr:hypothetical protein [Rubripirellula sp.]